MALPSSRLMVRPRSSWRSTIRSAAFRRIRKRSYPDSFAITRAPRTALWSARSTSPRSARGTVSTTERSKGFSTGIVWGFDSHSPATYMRIVTPSLKVLSGCGSLALHPHGNYHARSGGPQGWPTNNGKEAPACHADSGPASQMRELPGAKAKLRGQAQPLVSGVRPPAPLPAGWANVKLRA